MVVIASSLSGQGSMHSIENIPQDEGSMSPSHPKAGTSSTVCKPSPPRSTIGDNAQRQRLMGNQSASTEEAIEMDDVMKAFREGGHLEEMETTTANINALIADHDEQAIQHGVQVGIDAAFEALEELAHQAPEQRHEEPDIQRTLASISLVAPTDSTANHRPLTPQERQVADALERNYGGAFRNDESGGRAQMRALCERRARELLEFLPTPHAATKRVKAMLSDERLLRLLLGGVVMVGAGYSGGTWAVMRKVLPALEKTGLHPMLRGCIGGLIISTCDKVIGAGALALLIKNSRAMGRTVDFPSLTNLKPSKLKAAFMKALVAGGLTFAKNKSARDIAMHLSAPDLHKAKLFDVTADTAGAAFGSGPGGQELSNFILMRKIEGANLLAQEKFLDHARDYSSASVGEAAGKGALQKMKQVTGFLNDQGLTFLQGAGESFTKPSSYVNAFWCSMMMGFLEWTHAYIKKQNADPDRPNFISHKQAELHNLASSVDMGILVGLSVFIGIYGPLDSYREKFANRFRSSEGGPAESPSSAEAPEATGASDVLDAPGVSAGRESGNGADESVDGPHVIRPRIQEIE